MGWRGRWSTMRRGRDQGLDAELEIVGMGYRAEMKGKSMVVFNLGFLAFRIEYPLPTGVMRRWIRSRHKIALPG